ncbi:MAG: hypothetical protein DRJ64_04195 [Thermoprotei archaeon]|nr:MAG: hypothetical protein DRJ64_04195 [Thermoprotei archaeon]
MQYHDVCCLGKQAQRLLQQVPRERVKFILLDDMKKDTRSTWLEILDFLGLDDDGRTIFPVKNRAKVVKLKALTLLNKTYASFIQRLALNPLGTGFLTFLNKLNIQECSRPPLPLEFRQELLEAFYDDICLLEEIIGRDLSSWKNLTESYPAKRSL